MIGDRWIELKGKEIHDKSAAFYRCRGLCLKMDGKEGRDMCMAFTLMGLSTPRAKSDGFASVQVCSPHLSEAY